MRSFDAVLIGGGPAGEVAAGRLAEGGLEVALVEQHLVGGECSFYACMPSKALLRPAEILREVRRIPGAAEMMSGDMDVEAVLERRDEIIHDLDDSSMLPWLEERDITLIRGHGAIAGEKRVRVGDEELEARRGLESIGLEPKGYVEVDEHMQVPEQPWLYAIGDVNERALFTHMGKYQARIAADHILGRDVIVGATIHGRRGGRLPARGDDRDRRRGTARAPAPRGAVVPDAQRAVAATA